MNRMEFFKRLEYLLRGLPHSEKMDALTYYNDYFDEAGVENEQRVIQELGSPEAVAEKILEDYRRETGYNYNTREAGCAYNEPETEYNYTTQENGMPNMATQQTQKKKLSAGKIALIVVLLILTCPIWIGVVAGLFGAVVGILGALFGVVVGLGGAAIGLVVASAVCIVAGIIAAIAIPLEGLAMIGIGALLFALGMLLALLVVLVVGHWLPLLVKTIIKWIKGIKMRREGGNEI